MTGDFNINILKCDSDKDTADFVDTIYASSLYPTINTPTRITATSKTLIDNLFYNDFTTKITAGNMATSISDHLTQFLIIIETKQQILVMIGRKKSQKFKDLIKKIS